MSLSSPAPAPTSLARRSTLPWVLSCCLGCAQGPPEPAQPSTPLPPNEQAPSALPHQRDDSSVPAWTSSTPHVRFWLEGELRALIATERSWVAAHFEIPEGTHLYWQNPGETGLPTSVKFLAPPELRPGPTRYPGPRRFTGEGGTTSYGYTGHVALFTEVTVLGAPSGPLELVAEATWLACREVCRRETGSARLPLPAAPTTPTAFAEHLQRLPSPASEARIVGARRSPHLIALVAPPELELLEFFPLARLGPEDHDCEHRPGTTPSELLVELRYQSPLPSPIAGVVRAREAGRERFFGIELD